MSDTQNTQATDQQTKTADAPGATDVQKSASDKLVEYVENIGESVEKLNTRLDEVQEDVKKAQQTQYPYGAPNGHVHGVRTGESPLTSRPFSLMRLARGLRDNNMRDVAKVELDLAKRLGEQSVQLGWSGSGMLIPFAPDHMPTDDVKLEDGRVLPGYTAEIVKECRDIMPHGEVDTEELAYIAKRSGFTMIAKDLSANTATVGGTLVGMPSQGQLIDLLRPMELFTRVGAQEMTLPPSGSIRFPRDTGDPTISAYAEGETITESTPTTSELVLEAKKYSGLVDIPVELFQFATSVSVEAWLRNKFVRQIAEKTDRDQINGPGGKFIQGIVNYANIEVVIASTTGGAGDTLEADDPSRLIAAILENNARADLGMFFAIRPNLWQRVTHRRADAVSANDSAGPYLFITAFNGSDPIPDRLEGLPTLKTTQIPTNRVKGGSGETLTLLLAGVGRSWVIGRSGVASIDMTNSDASKFQQGLNTMRGMVFMDAGPEHEDEFGMIDDLLPTT